MSPGRPARPPHAARPMPPQARPSRPPHRGCPRPRPGCRCHPSQHRRPPRHHSTLRASRSTHRQPYRAQVDPGRLAQHRHFLGQTG
eukprot:scaffold4038_cov118-Isochrysis_galbana.AAC.3